jgi:hypothetical protein
MDLKPLLKSCTAAEAFEERMYICFYKGLSMRF